MGLIRFLTSGESHGRALVGILEGIPAGLELSVEEINFQLARRQRGHGRGNRMKIEKDRVQILAGVRFGKTLGSPIALMINNRDWENWQGKMSVESGEFLGEEISVPRPGHADFAGRFKYGHRDMRNILERASARETAMRVAIGAVARKLLSVFKIDFLSQVIRIGDAHTNDSFLTMSAEKITALKKDITGVAAKIDESPVRCLSPVTEKEMLQVIDEAKEKKETVGGIFEVMALDLPIGLGSHVHWDKRLDGTIAGAMMSIPAIKSVEIGLGRDYSEKLGSEVHDQLYFDNENGFSRSSNNAGGIEGGMTNGEPLIVRCAMKPIPTLMKPLASVDMNTLQETKAHKERSDVCAVPAASVVGEAVLALVLANACCEKFGGDSVEEMLSNYKRYEHACGKQF